MIRLSEVPNLVEELTGERPPAVGTVHRWVTAGIAGVRLRTSYVCGCRRTTEQWILDFFDGVDAAKSGCYVELPKAATKQRRREFADADAELLAIGC